MNQYQKINGLYKRYKEGDKKGKFIIGEYSQPEFEFLKDIIWTYTEKIDGTNIRCCIYTDPLVEAIDFQGKTDKAQLPKHLLEKLFQLFPKEEVFSVFEPSEEMPDVCIYGEGFGYKIQSGGKYMQNPKEVDFILFDIKIGHMWLQRKDLEDIAEKLNIKIVPLVGEGTIDEAIEIVKNGYKSNFGDFVAEGLVIKPKIELRDRRGHRLITKIKYVDFKEEDE